MDVISSRPLRSARKAKGSGHVRRAEILAAAERIFLEYGYEGATIRKIADAVGVSSTALYMHFQDKSGILLEICEATFGKLLAQNTEIAALKMEPVARVRLMLEGYMRFALDNPNAYQVIFCWPNNALDGRQRQSVEALSDRCYDLFCGAVGQIAETGRLKGEVEAAAQVAWAAAHGIVALLIGRPDFHWKENDALRSLMLNALFDGLVAR